MLDRDRLTFHPLVERRNRVSVETGLVATDALPAHLPPAALQEVERAAAEIRRARERDRPVILAFGAHTIKNGLGPVLIELMGGGWVTHLATNGAGVIHDWELAFQGETSEDVRANVAEGLFGMWQETGFWINLAINVGAYRGLGYGESVGSLVERDGLEIPGESELRSAVLRGLDGDAPASAGTAADMLEIVRRFDLEGGFLPVHHAHPQVSVQAAAFRLRVPFTAHPMFGHDIIYTHPMNHGAMIGRAAERDFLRFAGSVVDLQDGVYLSVGSAVMSPMIFEKSLSMARNLARGEARQDARGIDRFSVFVVDLAEAAWDWQREGEPPPDHPAYYHRFCKTFSRMGGTMRYVCADNRDFLLGLLRTLVSTKTM